MKAVLDTNIIVAGLYSKRGASYYLMSAALSGELSFAVSPLVALEYEGVLNQKIEEGFLTPAVCAGKPCIRGTRIYIAVIPDALAEGLTPEQIIEHYPQLTIDDIRASLAYAAELARKNAWKVAAGG
jgi:uncharacterized protein (DUF433 family)